jgi:Cysteine-rich CPCC
VQWQGERFGWGAYVPGETKRPTSAQTPVAAIAAYLDYPAERAPRWMRDLSERLERKLARAPRYACDCCGYRTLLNPGHYDICAVCGWEDDRADLDRRDGGPDAPSGPNHISLTEGRANFARFGASKERSRQYVREPRPREYP